jgi:hypothetical protein
MNVYRTSPIIRKPTLEVVLSNHDRAFGVPPHVLNRPYQGRHHWTPSSFLLALLSAWLLLAVGELAAQDRLVLSCPNMQKGADNDLLISVDTTNAWFAASFSLEFDPECLEFLYATNCISLHSWVITNGVGPGQVGFMLAGFATNYNYCPMGGFRARFHAFASTNTSTHVRFGDQTIRCEIAHTDGITYPLQGEAVTIWLQEEPQRYGFLEGDVFPMSTTNYLGGDGEVLSMDSRLTASMVIGIFSPVNDTDFQALDTAPRQSSGDGSLTVADYVQTQRYALGLDLVRSLAGPGRISYTQPPVEPTKRAVQFGSHFLIPGETNVIPIWLESQGNEQALAFSLSFDTNCLEFLDFSPFGATCNNTSQATNGVLAVLTDLSNCGLPDGRTNRHSLVFASFWCKTSVPPQTTIRFHDAITYRQICDTNAAVLPARFEDGEFQIVPGYFSAPAVNGSHLDLAFTGKNNGRYAIESSSNLINWTRFLTISNSSTSFRIENALRNQTRQFYRATPLTAP